MSEPPRLRSVGKDGPELFGTDPSKVVALGYQRRVSVAPRLWFGRLDAFCVGVVVGALVIASEVVAMHWGAA